MLAVIGLLQRKSRKSRDNTTIVIDDTLTIGPYVGQLTPGYDATDLRACLAELPRWLASPSARLIAGGRNRHVQVDLPVAGRNERVIVKAFGRQSWLKDVRDRKRGSKARRTWVAAEHLRRAGVGTPLPMSYLERWDSGRLVESYFLAAYEARAVSFRDALLKLYHEAPEASHFIELLECVAAGVRRMHAAGFLHNDLGNQNILLQPMAPYRWDEFRVIDLNRGRVRDALSIRERARDLSRLDLPSALLSIFLSMYWQGTPPRALLEWEHRYRWRYSVHARSRPLRHPLREARRRREEANEPPTTRYPEPRDIWIWDERSGQPVPTLDRRDRLRLYPAHRGPRLLSDTLRAAPAVWRDYRALLGEAFTQRVNITGRIGMAVNPTPPTMERELALLVALGPIPAFVRFYHHESREQRRFRSEVVRALDRAGHRVSIALVQDRKAVTNPAAWREFAGDVLESVDGAVEAVEVGHNINRAKWGIWSFRELRTLYDGVAELHTRYPTVQWIGPAAIDFEYAFVLAALREWPRGLPLAALSHHLYVDRRGAPENRQGMFAALEKFALARAIARATPACGDRLIITEVNWPIRGTGVYSPIQAPYLPPDHPADAGVSEGEYGDYLLRYLCLALASGLVDRIYWWRLVAHGFGLVDERDPDGWRERPAYGMLRTFLRLLGESTFVHALVPRTGNRHGRYRFSFERPDGEIVALTYAHGPAVPFPADEPFGRVEDAFGRPLSRAPDVLSSRPVYLRGL